MNIRRKYTQGELDTYARTLADAADVLPDGLVIHIAVASPYPDDGTLVAVRSTLGGSELQRFVEAMARTKKTEVFDA